MKTVKLGTLVLEFLKQVNWDQDFDLILHALYVGFGLPEADIKQHVSVPPHLRNRLDTALRSLKQQAECDGWVRGSFPHDPEGAVPAALRWLADKKAEYAAQAIPPPPPDTDDSDTDTDEDEAPDTATVASPTPSADTDTDDDTDAFHLQSLDDLLARKPSLPPFVVSGMFRHGEVTLIVGASGTGKTFLTRQVVVTVAAGVEFLGHSTTSRPSIMFDCEMGSADQAVSLAAIVHKMGLDRKSLPIYVLDATQRLDELNAGNLFRILVDACKSNGVRLSGSLLVIDTLGELACGAEENAVKEMLPVLRTLRTLARRYGLSIILTHHTVKGKDKGKNILFRGSSAIRGAVDNLWYLAPKGKSKTLWILTCDKCRRGEPFQDVTLAREPIPAFGPAADSPDVEKTVGFLWVPRGATSDGGEHPQGLTESQIMHGRTLASCIGLDGQRSYKELCDLFQQDSGLGLDSAKTQVRNAVKNGFLVQPKPGLYVLGPQGRDFLQLLNPDKAAAE